MYSECTHTHKHFHTNYSGQTHLRCVNDSTYERKKYIQCRLNHWKKEWKREREREKEKKKFNCADWNTEREIQVKNMERQTHDCNVGRIRF